MKRFTTLLLVVTALVISKPSQTFAQVTGKSYCPTNFFRICFTDAYGYRYLLKDIDLTDCNVIYATGVAQNIGNGSVDWNVNMTADFSSGGRTGTVEIHVVNPLMDGCAGDFVDSFVYVGTMTITNSGGVRGYSGSGTWTSYCSGSVFATSNWSASGPCGTGLQQINTDPKKPASVTSSSFQIKISPNPVKNMTNVSYNLSKASNVNITIYNMMNQPVKVLVNENQSKGAHLANWNGQTVSGTRASNGIYKVVATVNGKIYSENIQVIQ